MHTVIVIAVGFGVLAICALVGRSVDGVHGIAIASMAFLPIWFVGAAINLFIGVKQAGYSLREEAPIFLVIFAVPAIAAVLLWWKYR
jgi:hypothetical protein